MMPDFSLGTDVLWSLIALAVVSAALIVVPLVLERRGAARPDSTLRLALADLLNAAARPALIGGVIIAVLLLVVPGGMDVRFIRAGALLVGILVGVLTTWRMITPLASAVPPVDAADAPEGGSGEPGTAAAETAAPDTSALGAAGLLTAIAVFLLQASAGIPLITAAGGLALFLAALQAVRSVTGVGAISAHLLVGVLEREEKVAPGASAERADAALDRASGTLLRAVLALLLPGAVITAGGPLIGVHAVILGLIGVIAIQVAAVLPHLLGRLFPQSAVLRTAIGAGIPLAGLIAGLVLWLPSRYSQLRMAQAGHGFYDDPLLLSMFVSPNPDGSPPAPLNRDVLEPQMEEIARNFHQFQEGLDDSPAVQRVADEIVLHGQNPSALIGIALGIGALSALAIAVLSHRITAGELVQRQARTGRTGHIGAQLAGFGTTALVVTVSGAVLAAAGTGLLVLTTGNREFALMLTLAAALAAAVVLSALGEARSRVLTGAVLGGALIGLLVPISNVLGGTKRLPVLWEDRALRSDALSSPTILAGGLLGLVSAAILAGLLAETLRRTTADSVLDARDAADSGADAPLESRAVRGRTLALVPVLLAPAGISVAAFGIGGAALQSYVAVLAAAAATLTAVAAVRGRTAVAALAEYHADRFGGRGSWGHSAVTVDAASARVTGLIAQATAAGVAAAAILAAVLAPFVAQVGSDGSSPILRLLIAVCGVLVIVGMWAQVRGVKEPDLRDD